MVFVVRCLTVGSVLSVGLLVLMCFPMLGRKVVEAEQIGASGPSRDARASEKSPVLASGKRSPGSFSDPPHPLR